VQTQFLKTQCGWNLMSDLTRQGEDVRRVLIVEGDAVVALDIEESLTDAGWQVAGVAGSGEEAWRLLAAAPADIAIVDEDLHGPVHAMTAVRRIRERFGLRVVLLSGSGEPAPDGAREAVAAQTRLEKPFSCPELIRLLEEIGGPSGPEYRALACSAPNAALIQAGR